MSGVLTCPGIFPTVLSILWHQQSKAAAIISPLLGMATGVAVWLGSAHALYGEVTITTTGNVLPCVYGTVASAFSPLPYSVIITLIKPQNFDWADFSKTKLSFDEDNNSSITDVKKNSTFEGEVNNPLDPRYKPFMKRWANIAAFWSLATFLGHWVLWPLPIYASRYVFSKLVSSTSFTCSSTQTVN
jgi:urea-proton symporter